MKECNKCNNLLPDDAFYKKRRNKDGLQTTCKECQVPDIKNRYQQNRNRYAKRIKERRKETVEWYREYKRKLACKHCGYNSHFIAIDLHHVDSEDKEMNLSEAVRKGWSREKLIKEIEKCVPLCANCHRILHWNKRQEQE